MKRTCIQCGKEFELSNSEIGFYKKRKLSLPKRCKECREMNKKTGAAKKGGAAQGNADRNTAARTGAEKKYENNSGAQKTRRNDTVTVNQPETKNCNCAQKKAKSGIKRILAAAAVLVAAGIYGVLSGNLPLGGSQFEEVDYTFRTEELFESHYEKHGIEMGFDTAEEYLAAANDVIDSSKALHKTEAEDGDDIYFLEDTNEFVVLSTDGYIRTYYIADGGMEYFERQ